MPPLVPKQDQERWSQVMCKACGWKREHQECTAYWPGIKLIEAIDTRGTWGIGERYVVRELRTDVARDPQPRFAEANMEFVNKNTSIPVPKLLHSWLEGKKYFLMTTRMPGVSLESCYPESDEEIDRYAKETAEFIVQLRSLTKPTPGATTGKPLCWRGFELSAKPEDMLVNFLGTAAQREECLENWPVMEPFTFTHVDLVPRNIMIHNGHVSGILEWDSAGYCPAWDQYVSLDQMELDWWYWGKRVAFFLGEIPGQGFPDASSFFQKWGRLIY